MEANAFITRLKADTVEKYKCNLHTVLEEYKLILNKLPAKDRGLFGLNVLRTLCWNLDKAPIWRDNVDNSTLLTLAKECIKVTRLLDREDQVKTLACIYHLHKHAVRLNKPVLPELVLNISLMPFLVDSKHLLKDYHKTYWQILADRLTYMERLQSKVNITKLLPTLTADIIKLVEIYDTVQFCSTIIVYLFKKLHMLYREIDASKLTQTFRQIFTALCKKDDIAKLKELPEREMSDIYTKLNDCLYVVADNSSKLHFKDGTLNDIVQSCVVLVNHRKDLFFCLQTFYETLFCKIVSYGTSISYVETLFGSLEETIQNCNKLGYENALLATYPYLNQLLRLYIEYNISNSKTLTETIQTSCLKLILFFSKKLKHCNQIIKCENCPNKTGLHDAFCLSLQTKHLIQHGQKEALDTFYLITTEQYAILAELEKLGCANYQRYSRKLQTDIHNTAITLNKSKLYSTSIKLFDIYLKNELKSKEIDHKNISRALFNRSICELDSKLYEKALVNAFLSLTFAQQEGLSSDKYMSLVMDVKARELKDKDDDDDEIDADRLQLVTVLDACKMALNSQLYGDLRPFLKKLKFSTLLRGEYSAYARLWPSVAPVGGVWRALAALARGEHDAWETVENEAEVSEILYDVVLETPSVVRTINSPYFSTIVGELLDDFDNMTTLTPDEKLVHATLLFLQCEYDLSSASQEYNWKITEPGPNPDSLPSTRTLPQEHAATRRAIVAVQLLRDFLPGLPQASRARLPPALAVLEALVPRLQLVWRRAAALQLAHGCCLIADLLGDRESYLRNAGVLLSSSPPAPAGEGLLARAARGGGALGESESEIVFLCDVATYYISQGKPGVAARLVRAARARILNAMETQPELNLDLAVGRVLELQYTLCGRSGAGPGALSAANGALRHYLGLGTTGSKWSVRRLRSLTVRLRSSVSGLVAVSLARALGLRARARAAAGGALPAAAAAARALLHAEIIDVASFDSAQVKIDQNLKEILGLQSSNEPQSSYVSDTQKQPLFTPRQELETMRDNMVLRKQTFDVISSVPAFKVPDFFHHHAKCTCYACEIPVCLLLAYKTSSIEAALYAFANENEIARNYFQGVSNMFDIAEKKFKKIRKMYTEVYDDFIVESVLNSYEMELKTIKIKSLIDVAFFELKNNELDAADETVVEINEIVREVSDLDQYLKNDVLNLMVASVQMKKGSKKRDLVLEEFDNLNISPAKENIEPPSTPETKPSKPPKVGTTKKIVDKEELPQKRLLNLDSVKLDWDRDENDFEKPKPLTRGAKKDKFKIPKPIIPKPTLEEATPRPFRSKPRVIVTEPSVDMATPVQANKENIGLFTPIESTPEQFFTPMTSVKTYSKKSLRQDIVKNLEKEFSSPTTTGIENRTETLTIANPLEKRERSSAKGDSKIKADTLKLKELKPKVKEEKLTVKENLKVKEHKDGNTATKGRTSRTGSARDAVNIPGSSRGRKEEKRTLIRVVSPGKMNKEEKNTRSRRQ